MIITKDQVNDYIGKEVAVTDWVVVDQDRINQFADVTMDHQFIHTDPERAKSTPFGSTIAHGLLTLSFVPYFMERSDFNLAGSIMVINYGFDKVRFLSPVKVDSRVRGRIRLLEVTEKRPGQLLTKFEITAEVEGVGKPAMLAEYLVLNFLEG